MAMGFSAHSPRNGIMTESRGSTTFTPSLESSNRASSAKRLGSRPAASNGVLTAPSKSEPSATWRSPTRSTTYRMLRATSAVLRPQTAVSQKPTPITPPPAAMARTWKNEDGKKFVFVEDIAGPLLGLKSGTEAAS